MIRDYYHQIYNITRTKSKNLNVSRLVLQSLLLNPLKPGVKNEDVIGAAPTADAPTTSGWSTILVPTKVSSYVTGLAVVMIGSDNGLLPELILTNFYDTI